MNNVLTVTDGTISAAYVALNARLHADNPAYGAHGALYAKVVLSLTRELGTYSVLDYGAGKGSLAAVLPFPIAEFDPAIDGKTQPPAPADVVICTDVLEHVEPECLTAVLTDLQRCIRRVGYFVIHTGPSSKCLADGRNSHVLQHDREWWAETLRPFFDVTRLVQKGRKLHISVRRVAHTHCPRD